MIIQNSIDITEFLNELIEMKPKGTADSNFNIVYWSNFKWLLDINSDEDTPL